MSSNTETPTKQVGRPRKYNDLYKEIEALNVGETHFVDASLFGKKPSSAKILSTTHGIGRKFGYKLVMRKCEEGGVKGYRIWRAE